MAASDQPITPRSPVARISTTVLMIATILLLLMVIGVTIAAWVITRQPADRPLQVQSVSQI